MLSQTKPDAVLWDYDGTLVDTEPLWIAAEIELMASYGVTWSYEQGLGLCGSPADVSTAIMFAEIVKQTGAPVDLAESEFWPRLTQDVIRRLGESELPWRPGAYELVTELAAREIPQALVSASPTEMIQVGIERMPAGLFDTVITGPDAPRGKPAPDPYLLAAAGLGVQASDCIVIEDSIPGTEAGRAAGAVVIGVPSMQPLPQAPGQILLETLAGLGPDDLTRIWYEARND